MACTASSISSSIQRASTHAPCAARAQRACVRSRASCSGVSASGTRSLAQLRSSFCTDGTVRLSSSGFSGSRDRRALRRERLSARAEGSIPKLNSEELEVAISERDRPLIIDFYATWCGPCLLLATELEKVAEELGDAVRIVKVDTDEEQQLSSQLQIQGLPTVVFVGMDPAKPALRTEGLLSAEVIKDIVNKELS